MSVILVCGPVSQWVRVTKETDRYQKFYQRKIAVLANNRFVTLYATKR